MDFDFTLDTITPDNGTVVTVSSTGALVLPNGTTAQRPAGSPGMMRLNTTGYTSGTTLEYYDGTAAAWEFMVDASAIISGGGNAVTVDNVSGTVTITNTGSGSGTNFNYNARTNTQANADPGVGNVVWNNATILSSTQLYISAEDNNFVDQTNYLNTITIGAQLYLQDQNVSSVFQRWAITSITHNAGTPGWFTFGVTLINQNGAATVANNHKIYLAFSGSGNVTTFQTSLSGLTPSAATSGPVTLAGTLGYTSGGTGLTTLGTAGQLLGTNQTATGLEYITLTPGAGISVTSVAGSLTVSSTVGGVTTFNYNSKTNTQAAANPGSGFVVWNNATLDNATSLYVCSIDANGIDQTVLWNKLAVGSILYIQAAGNSSNFERWTVGSVTNNTGWFTVTVTLLNSSPFTINNNSKLYLGWGYIGSAAVTSFSAGTTGLTPNTGTTGAVTLAGTLGITNGGTGLASTPTNGQLLIGNGTGYTLSSLTAGTGITITPGAGSITIASSATAGVSSIAGTTNQITASTSTGAVTLSVPSTFTTPGYLQVTGLTYSSNTVGIIAAGTTQGTATALTTSRNVISTVAAGTGVILPVPTFGGAEIAITNRGANTLLVYPNSGAAIDSAATNAAIPIPSGSDVTITSASATQWYTTDPSIVAGANISVTYGNGITTIGASTAQGSGTRLQQSIGNVAGATSTTVIYTPAALAGVVIAAVGTIASPATGTMATIAGVVISGTGGTFTCTAFVPGFYIGQPITISGTLGGTGSITGYTNPTTYYIIATTANTNFTLSATLGGSAITTTAGTPTGLTYTSSSNGYFTCTAFVPGFYAGQAITVSGTLTGTGTITGYTNPTTYYVIDNGTGNTTFILSATPGGSAITTTAGTLTGLTFTPINSGYFTCTAYANGITVGQVIQISGTLGGTGTITGYVNPTTYYVIATTATTNFVLSATPYGTTAITTTVGTPTGLTYTPGPPITAGTQIWSQPFTPISSTSKMVVQFAVTLTDSTNNVGGYVFVYRGNTCINVTASPLGAGANTPGTCTIYFYDTPGNTIPTTYSARVAGSLAGTLYVNAVGAVTTTLGGQLVSAYTITEFA